MKKILLLLLFSISIFHYSQSDNRLLLGDWIVTKVEMSDGSPYFSQMPSSNPYKIFYFNKGRYFTKEYITDAESFIQFSIKIKDSLIIDQGNPHYKIEKLTKDELILLDVNVKKIDKTFGRYYLTRYESARNSDYQKIKKNTELTSTAAFSPYPKSNIFESDFKSDDEKEFKTKGYLIFNIERKSVETLLTDVSEIPPSSQIKLKEIFNKSYGKWNFSKIDNIKYIKVPFVAICYKIKIQNNTFSNISVGYNITDYKQITIPLDTQKIIDAEKYNALAIKCYESKDYNCAAENFKKSFLQNKYNLDAHYNYAAINLALGKKDLACQKWRELIEFGQKEAENELIKNDCRN